MRTVGCNMNTTGNKIGALIICAVMITAAVGCGSAPKRRISFHKGHRNDRSRYVVRGQSHKEPSAEQKKMFRWPLDAGIVMSGFGIRRGRRHDGVDISAKGGTPIKAAADGKVVFSGRMRGYGNLIVMKHEDDYFTAYAHNRRNLAKKGRKVKQGEVIAQVGRTGRATGNHVHFEVRKGQKAMDPMNFLPARAGVIVKKKARSTTKAKIASKKKQTKKKRTKKKRTTKTTVAKKGDVKKKSTTEKKPTTVTKKSATEKKTKTTVAKESKISSKKAAQKSEPKAEPTAKPKKVALKKSGKAMSNK